MLKDAPIEISDTVYGRYEAQKKRDVKTVYQKMYAEERESLKQELVEIDNVEAGDRQPPPTNITPVQLIFSRHYMLLFALIPHVYIELWRH